MNKIKQLVIHHSASGWGDADEIRKWHKDKGWRDIGYNLVILNGKRKYKQDYNSDYDGLIEIGRGLDFDSYIDSKEKGAHTLGYNHCSIGVCFISENIPTPAQEMTLEIIIKLWQRIVPDIKVIGHREVNDTDCPGFDVQTWLMARGLK